MKLCQDFYKIKQEDLFSDDEEGAYTDTDMLDSFEDEIDSDKNSDEEEN